MMVAPDIFTCETCRFFDGLDDGLGACRRYPPRAVADRSERAHGGVFSCPVVNGSEDWCGEWTVDDRETDE